uniref:uncharacterized protein isoform X1 n=1 Tax=Myxine glutinosa TaxID=7769 RepID=UPI00359001F3
MEHASGVAPDPGRKCILHVGKADETTGNIAPITEDHWSSIINVAARRRQKRNFVTSKYYTIIQSLPDESDSSHGYHVNCYKNFTAVPRDDTTEKTQTHASSEKTLRSSCDFAPSTSTSVNGTTGEGESLSVAERKKLLEAWLSAGRDRLKHVIVNIGCSSITDCKELAKHAEQVGASAVAITTPSYFRPSTPGSFITLSH